jgi:thiol-disulfide isomerase/thioredoxin
VESPEDFDAHVRSETEKLVVVRFHSPYCPACKSISVSYDRLVKTSSPDIKFVDVTVMDRNDLIPYGLDVPATPYGMIWHPDAGMVEASAIPRRQFSKFKRILKWYVKGECELPEEFFSNPHNEYDLENLIL